MTRNTLGDLNNHLFMQLERLNEEDLSGEELKKEIERSKAIATVASQIISNGNLVLRAQHFEHEYRVESSEKRKMLQG